MAYNSINAVRQNYLKVAKTQLVVGLIGFLILSIVFRNLTTSISSALGLICALLPTLVYIKVVWNSPYLGLSRVFAQHKKAMLLKFSCNLGGFMLVVVGYHQLHFVALLLTYVLTLSGTWLSLLVTPSSAAA